MALVSRHWSGKHHAVVQGINLISLVWTDRECRLPCDFRLYNKVEDGLSKNAHFQPMLEQANQCGFEPELVVFDRWHSGLPNLKLLRSLNWHWLTQLKSNREVSIDRSGNRAISEIILAWPSERLSALKYIGFGQALPGLKPRQALFDLQCDCIWLIRPLLSVQLHKSYLY